MPPPGVMVTVIGHVQRGALALENISIDVEELHGLDRIEQARRFEAENCVRRSRGQRPIKVDRLLLGAMQHGLPDCSGVAVGLDRLLMLRLGENEIDRVLGFSLQRC